MDIQFKNMYADIEREQEKRAFMSKYFIIDEPYLSFDEMEPLVKIAVDKPNVVVLSNELDNDDFSEYVELYKKYKEIDENRYF